MNTSVSEGWVAQSTYSYRRTSSNVSHMPVAETALRQDRVAIAGGQHARTDPRVDRSALRLAGHRRMAMALGVAVHGEWLFGGRLPSQRALVTETSNFTLFGLPGPERPA